MDSSHIKESPFNSPMEFAIRTLALLAELEYPITLDRIVAYDFIATYPSAFDLGQSDVNGQNLLKFTEFASRRGVTSEAIKILLFKDLIEIEDNITKGFRYVISASGDILAENLKNEYLKQYRINVSKIEDVFKEYDDLRLASFINSKAINVLGE